METAPKPQRSPWFYVLLGCGGLAGLICLGGALVVGGIAKMGKDLSDGVVNTEEKLANAKKQLGTLPEGYSVVVSLKVPFLMQTTVLTDRPPLEDGGFGLSENAHTFAYFKVISNENTRKARDFFSGKDTSPETLARSGISIDTKDIIKRGQLTVEGRKLSWVASRGRMDTGGEGSVEGLNNAILFECPGDDDLQVGVWSQRDPAPEKAAEQLELAGTVADEAELARFLKQMNPCGR
ncbi:MAG: hypothetical protein ACOZQL_02645 [Myxococcota bacterium]